jgi:hypothetical protein
LAKAILAQLGGERFVMMTGATSFIGSADSLTFKLGSNPKRVTHVRVSVNPTRLRRGATGTRALLRRAIAKRERPRCAIGIEAKSCFEFRAKDVPLLILDPPVGANEQMFGAE